MTYQETLQRLRDTTADAVQSLWAQVEAGTLTREAFMDLAVILIQTARRQGLSLGSLSIRAYLEAVTGTPQRVTVPPPPEDRAQIAAGVATVLAGAHEQVSARIARLAGNEPVAAATEGAQWVMEWEPSITGYTRGLEAEACDLCTWWAAESHKFAPTAQMPRHPNCLCHQVPTIDVED